MVSGGGAATGERDALSGWLRRQLKGWWCNWRWLIAVLLVLMAYGVAVNVLYLGHASAMAAGGRSALYSSYLVWRTTLHLQTFERILEYVLPFCCILLFSDHANRFVSVP